MLVILGIIVYAVGWAVATNVIARWIGPGQGLPLGPEDCLFAGVLALVWPAALALLIFFTLAKLVIRQ